MKSYHIAVVGATGLVGRTMLKVLDERKFPISELSLFASKRSAGETIVFRDKSYTVQALTENSLKKPIDIALFSAGGATSGKFAPIAAENGVVVIDNASTFRMVAEVPLVVPEVNPDALRTHKGIIANPNCSTIQAVVALKPLHDAYGIKRVVYSTYQAVSGSGIKGIEALEAGRTTGRDAFYPHPIHNNCLPHIDVFTENGYTKEEMKMILETQKILESPALKVTATAVRVPIAAGHSESVNVELNTPFTLQDVKSLLNRAPGIVLQDAPEAAHYPLVSKAQGTDAVYVGRLRRDESVENGLNLWIVADNVRKGAATNAVQIAETLILNGWL